ncbi:unnamed protein product [Paramecium pentaurelia]|uniref:Uncharacterized protein n=1 Tax=Paramecium pentaurelia TaxID=43138 RepID=A0A8S1VKR2_9CILI|nr:unnamed protein product [Paramecium pentaurelia]
MYSGFLSKKLEYEYNSVVNRMMILLIDQLSLQLQLNQIANKTFFDKQFYKLYNQIKELEGQKAQPPKFSNLLQPLQFVIQNNGNQQITTNYQNQHCQKPYVPPILEQDAAFSTQYTKTQTISTRAKSQIVQARQQQAFSPNKVSRVCRYSDRKKPKVQLMNVGEFYADFQNESQILGKKQQNNGQRFHTLDQNSMMKTPLNLEAQQNRDTLKV